MGANPCFSPNHSGFSGWKCLLYDANKGKIYLFYKFLNDISVQYAIIDVRVALFNPKVNFSEIDASFNVS